MLNKWYPNKLTYDLPLLSGGDKETDGVIFSSNLAVRLDKDVDEPEADDDSLNVTIKEEKFT